MNPKTPPRRQFASDNWAGICPEAFVALAQANIGHTAGYGEDPWTTRAAGLIRDLFETECEVFFVFNGTAANSLALGAACQSYHSVLCHEHAHVETGECGAPEFFGHGLKLLLLPGENGKLDPATIKARVRQRADIHYPKPRAVSITQATEAGTVYSVDEVKAVCDTARQLGLVTHMDGARFANAVASLGVKPKEVTWQAGIEVLSFGGSKNGMAAGEAIVFFNRDLAKDFEYRRKQAGQLASKMRFLSASWVAMLSDGAWLRRARHANEMARRMEAALRKIPRLKILFPCQTNGVFVKMPLPVIKGLSQHGWHFYPHVNPEDSRLMCSWDTTEEDIEAFVSDLKTVISKA